MDAPGRSGRVRLMPRPEQFRLVPEGQDGSVPGLVLAVSFAGAAASVRVRLDGRPEPLSVVLAMPGYRAPEPGRRVDVSIDGPAHVLDECSPASVRAGPRGEALTE